MALSRRTVLSSSAAAGVAVLLGACSSGGGNTGPKSATPKGKASGKGAPTKPLAVPAKLREAPDLAAQVAAGKLPKLADRLPRSPYVVPHNWQQAGKYGGTLRLTSGSTNDAAILQYMYGHSILRWLNDGMDVGPGLAESWESNAEATEWTFHFREGLKWSDGEPWTTADIMYWWDDMVLNTEHPEVPPDEATSGNGAVAKISAPDARTLVLTFAHPAPLTADRLADSVNRGNGATWMQPRHYLEQFHPKYNQKITAEDWYTAHDEKADFLVNPDSPVMTGWRLTTYTEGRTSVWKRNPYYYCVDKAGNQLPYLDSLVWKTVQDPEVMKLEFTEGKVDFVNGQHGGLNLGDVQGLKQVESRTNRRVRFWDSGSGSGAMVFFNYDYPDAPMRELIRNPKFRQALSHAYNRKEVQKSLYFNTGELTTGTLSPKAPDLQANAEGRELYASWRDAYVAYDPDKAGALLDEIGVVDVDGDGYRERPDGEKLTVRLDFPADASGPHLHKNEYIRKDWEAVGIRTKPNPVLPTAWGDTWTRGELMTHAAWEVGGGGIMSWPAWIIPVIPDTWAPLHGQAFILRTGDPKKLEAEKGLDPWKRHPPWALPEKDSPIARLWDLYEQARVETDGVKHLHLLWQMCRIHIEEGPFFIGVVANYPNVILVHNNLRNVPERENLFLGGQISTWDIPVPAIYDPELWHWTDPEEHV